MFIQQTAHMPPILILSPPPQMLVVPVALCHYHLFPATNVVRSREWQVADRIQQKGRETGEFLGKEGAKKYRKGWIVAELAYATFKLCPFSCPYSSQTCTNKTAGIDS